MSGPDNQLVDACNGPLNVDSMDSTDILRPSQKELLVLDGQEAPMVSVDLVTSDLPHQIPHDAILKTFTFRPVTMQVTSSRSKFLENAALMSRKPFAGPVFKKELMKFGITGPVPFESRARCFCGSLARKPARPGRGQRCSWETLTPWYAIRIHMNPYYTIPICIIWIALLHTRTIHVTCTVL